MIHTADTASAALSGAFDLCIIGSGAGGATVALECVRAGLQVLLLEAGPAVFPDQMTQREEHMFPLLYRHSGTQKTRDRAIAIHQGESLGGSTMHNINLCKRAPHQLITSWHQQHELEALPPERWDQLYREIESRHAVAEIPAAMVNRHNQLLEAACIRLGWRHARLHHNRTGCIGSGFCELGCAYDAKNNALKVALAPALEGGLTVLVGCRATRVHTRRGQVSGVEAVITSPSGGVPRRIHIECPRVCVSASATGSAALLLRSRIPAPTGSIGRSLRIHPGIAVAGEFDQPVRAWQGVPQSVECTEYLDFDSSDRRAWIVPAFAHPMGLATQIPGFGAEHTRLMGRYDHLAAFSTMVHDHGLGQVEARGQGFDLAYRPSALDRQQLALGIRACADLLFAAGATRVHVPFYQPLAIDRADAVPDFHARDVGPKTIRITGVHPMGSIPMSDDPERAAVSSRGAVHRVSGLWVADGSLVPSSIGVPPQLTIYALGLHVGRHIVGAG